MTTNNQNLDSTDSFTALVKSKGIDNWNELVSYIQNLPYGRNSSRANPELVLLEKRGTCSSKHALLKSLADLNEVKDVKLILGLYKMTEANTKGISPELTNHNLKYIPEAHCYLKINGLRTDITNRKSDVSHWINDLIEEIEIQPDQVREFKLSYHKSYIKSWLTNNKMVLSYDEIWKIREKCINSLNGT